MASTLNAGMFRFSGIYGSAQDEKGNILSEVVEVSGTISRARIDLPLVGTTKTGHKYGRETREGTIRLQKIDTKWERAIWLQLNQTLDQRRTLRDSGPGTDPALAEIALAATPFTLIIDLDDPDAIGPEKWALHGVMASWTLPLGFAITDDVIERDYTMTWEAEEPVLAFNSKTVQGTGGVSILVPDWKTPAPTTATT